MSSSAVGALADDVALPILRPGKAKAPPALPAPAWQWPHLPKEAEGEGGGHAHQVEHDEDGAGRLPAAELENSNARGDDVVARIQVELR